MFKVKSSRKAMAVLLALVMMLMFISLTASAGVIKTESPLPKYLITIDDSNISTVVISDSAVVAGHTGVEAYGATKSVQIALSPNNTATTVTLTINPASDDSSSEFPSSFELPVYLTEGKGSASTVIGETTYTFNCRTEEPYVAAEHGNSYISAVAGEGVTMTYDHSSDNIHYYNASTTTTGFPQAVSLRIIPNGTSFDNIDTYTFSYQVPGASLTNYNGTYFLASFPADGSTLTTTISYTGAEEQEISTYKITLTQSGTPSTGTGLYAYCPAGGQFANEGVQTGGWGDGFTSGGALLKAFVNADSNPGISLGAFGGYAVFDMGENISNSNSNKFGVDFILYGNAFGGWAEPGCVQVAQDNGQGAPDKWYDIAGSRFYNDSTMWKYTATYTNPYPTDDATSNPRGFAGEPGYSVPYTYTYSYLGGNPSASGSGSGSVDYNGYHPHSFFPLWCNYFKAVSPFTNGMANLVSDGNGHYINNAGTVYTPYIVDPLRAATIALKGVNLCSASTANDTYLFGYCDAHANGMPSATQENPYTTGRTIGGDPIDISWAVYPAGSSEGGVDISGQPKALDSIRFVRVYTGVQAMQGAFGESSTEVCGVYKATATGSGATAGFATVTVGGLSPTDTSISTTQRLSTISVSPGTYTISVTSGATYLMVNGAAVSSPCSIQITATSGSTLYYQIITQTGTTQPKITVLKITTT